VIASEQFPGNNPGHSAAHTDDDTEGCLCLVVGYAKKDGLIADVTAEVERRIMMSPALSDFLQLRYVDLGPQPGQAGDRYRPVHQVVDDLMAVQDTAGHSHFALIVIAKSAVTIEDLLGSCAVEPFLSRLRMRLAGIASSDDRKEARGSVDIVSSPSGSWHNERQLVDALRQRCEELPRYFATRGEPGLTRADFAALQRGYARPDGDASNPDSNAAPGGGGVAGQTPTPDLLDARPETAAMTSGQDVAPADAADGRPIEAAADGPAAGRGIRWRPRTPWRRDKQAAELSQTNSTAPGQPVRTAVGLAYLLMMVDHDAAADPAIDRLQAALLAVDRRLAAQPTCRYQVRVIHGSGGGLGGEPHDAGRASRRVAKRPVNIRDFTAVLKVIRSSLRHDCLLVQRVAAAAGLTIERPTVVIFTADPPIPDSGTASVFGDIAAQATVVWVVPERLEGLVSPAFGSACGAAVLGVHQAVADEILDVMHSDASDTTEH
jgi:hypothetical protein